jgi:hypothetical protein
MKTNPTKQSPDYLASKESKMKKIGLCTHFSHTDDWAFEFALGLVRTQGWQLIICHWVHSPYSLRRDMVYSSLTDHSKIQPISPKLLTKLELDLRQFFEPKLGDFTDVAFKLCEGIYQVELTRCFRQHLLDLVVMGYRDDEQRSSGEQPLEVFASHLHYPLIIVGPDDPNQFQLNQAAEGCLDELELPEGSWQVIEETAPVHS